VVKVKQMKELKRQILSGRPAFYLGLEIVVLKTSWGVDRIRTRGSDLFFKPWLPAVKLG